MLYYGYVTDDNNNGKPHLESLTLGTPNTYMYRGEQGYKRVSVNQIKFISKEEFCEAKGMTVEEYDASRVRPKRGKKKPSIIPTVTLNHRCNIMPEDAPIPETSAYRKSSNPAGPTFQKTLNCNIIPEPLQSPKPEQDLNSLSAKLSPLHLAETFSLPTERQSLLPPSLSLLPPKETFESPPSFVQGHHLPSSSDLLPPPKEMSLLPKEELSPPPKEMSLLPTEELSPPPKELSLLPKEDLSPPPKEMSLLPKEDLSPPPTLNLLPPSLVEETTPSLDTLSLPPADSIITSSTNSFVAPVRHVTPSILPQSSPGEQHSPSFLNPSSSVEQGDQGIGLSRSVTYSNSNVPNELYSSIDLAFDMEKAKCSLNAPPSLEYIQPLPF